MDLSDSLSITQKGMEEILNRTFQLNVLKRSVLILLGKPETVGVVLNRKGSLRQEEVFEIISSLAHDGFVDVNNTPSSFQSGNTIDRDIHLLNGIIISEARFLLVNFCVDCFETESQGFVELLNKCKNVNNLQACLNNIRTEVELNYLEHMLKLKKIILEINATA